MAYDQKTSCILIHVDGSCGAFSVLLTTKCRICMRASSIEQLEM